MRFYFYRGRGFWAALIRWFTRSKYAHVSVVFSDGEVYEAVPGRGVIKGKLKSVDGVTPFVYKAGVVPNIQAARNYCESELGTEYDYWGCLCFVLGIKQRRSASRIFCSEYASTASTVAGVELQERVEHFKLSPDNLSWSAMICVDEPRKFQWDHAGRYI